MSEFVNQFILGDNLEVLKTLSTESIDMIYIDPPFFTNRNYEVIWGDKGEIMSFEDRWSGGIDHYISWLKERVIEMHRVLKRTGSMIVHCDWHADSYIRVEILDKIFGSPNFKSEIVWQRTNAHNDAKQGRKAVGNITDTIWYYTKSEDFKFNHLYAEYSKDYINNFYKFSEPSGRKYRLSDMTAPGGGAKSKGNPFYEFLGIKRYWRYSQENMNKLYAEGRIVQTKAGNVPQYKRYLDEMPGVSLQNLWTDIPRMEAWDNERIGYPTQKPEKLLERIIKMVSNEGDVLMDPFLGGGTTCAVADKLNRRWIGIDSSVAAIKISEFRLNKQQDLFSRPFVVQLHKYEYEMLRYLEAFQFETWIVEQFGGMPNVKQRNDLGLDGKKGSTPIQVKRSDNIGRNVIDNFLSACKRYDKNLFEKNLTSSLPVGYIIAFSFSKGAIQEVARLHNQENVIIKLVRVDEIVKIAYRPLISVDLNDLGIDKKGNREIEFIAKGKSDIGIEFYAWDWEYDPQKGFKPEVFMDRGGRQVNKFKPGIHHLAVKVVDMEGFDNIEPLRLKVNGSIEKITS